MIKFKDIKGVIRREKAYNELRRNKAAYDSYKRNGFVEFNGEYGSYGTGSYLFTDCMIIFFLDKPKNKKEKITIYSEV